MNKKLCGPKDRQHIRRLQKEVRNLRTDLRYMQDIHVSLQVKFFEIYTAIKALRGVKNGID
jgi:hypothetical protein